MSDQAGDSRQHTQVIVAIVSTLSAQVLPPILLQWLRYIKRQWLRRGSTGLDGLDLRLIEVIEPRHGGYFVELGANDGLSQSNTWKLQRAFGWTGLLIEPSPIRYRECVMNRSFARVPHVRCAACVPFGFVQRFVEIEDADLMSVAKGLDVDDRAARFHADCGMQFLDDPRFRYVYGAPARTLTSLLDEVQAPLDFDLLSLDVEGNELSVLKGLDFKRYRPRWILVEARGVQIGHYLEQLGYEQQATLSQNDSYADVLFRLPQHPTNVVANRA